MTSAPLKWHGGKHYLASRIIALMPPHTHYVEPYFGGGSVLLAKDPEDVSEVVNDLNGELAHFWSVLRCPADVTQLIRLCEATPFSEELFRGIGPDTSDPHPVDRAWRFFVRCRQSLAGRMKAFTGITKTRTRRRMNNEVSAWITAVEGLPAVHERLKRVLILNRPALDVIRSQDGPGTLFYLDPPYLHETRATTADYACEMIAADHAALLNVLESVEGKFMLSGYRSALYDAAALRSSWSRIDFVLPNNSAGGKIKRRMIECVWANFQLPTAERVA